MNDDIGIYFDSKYKIESKIKKITFKNKEGTNSIIYDYKSTEIRYNYKVENWFKTITIMNNNKLEFSQEDKTFWIKDPQYIGLTGSGPSNPRSLGAIGLQGSEGCCSGCKGPSCDPPIEGLLGNVKETEVSKRYKFKPDKSKNRIQNNRNYLGNKTSKRYK